MDGNPGGGAGGGDRGAKRPGRRARGIAVIERGGFWHVVGTVVARGRSVRVRKSTGLAARRDLYDTAWDEARRIEAEIIGEITGARRPGDFLSVAAERYLTRKRERPLGASTISIVQELVAAFGTRRLNDIPDREWQAFVDRRHAANAAATRERYLNAVVAFLAWCASPKSNAGLATVPAFDRDAKARNPNRRARRRVREMRPDLIGRLIRAAHIAVRAQLAVEWSTGARVSSVLHGCRVCDLILAPGRSQITFHDTKNGTSVTAALHPAAVRVLEDYLAWRGRLHDREAPLFLTPLRRPYKDVGGAWSGQNKTAFNAAKRRAAGDLRRDAAATARTLRTENRRAEAWDAIAAAKADAALLGQVTQHWFRHLLATRLLQIGDIRTAMDQGGWIDQRSVMGYSHDAPEHRRRIVDALDGFDTTLTHDRDQSTASNGKINAIRK